MNQWVEVSDFNIYLFSKCDVTARLMLFPGLNHCQHFNYNDPRGQEELGHWWDKTWRVLIWNACLGATPLSSPALMESRGRRELVGQNVERHLKAYEPKLVNACIY